LNEQQINKLSSLGTSQPQNIQSPDQNIQAPMSPGEASGVYQLLTQKGTTDTDARKRNLFASNIEKTLSQINPDDLTRYAGIPGTIQKLGEEFSAPFGKESQDYKNHLKSTQAADVLATQVRQFYGDSIQPSMIERLQKITNPSMWNNNPGLAKELFNQTKNILQMEMKTYRDAMRSTSPYREQSNSSQMVHVSGPGGGASIPANNVDAFLRDHPEWRRG
jgi:hypothetical protein